MRHEVGRNIDGHNLRLNSDHFIPAKT